MPIYLVPQARSRRSRRRQRLGSFSDWFPSWNPLTWLPASTVESELGKAYTYVTAPIGSPGTIPGTSGIADVIHNATYGTLTDSQKQAIVQQEVAGLVRAGVDPATAAAQANSDVTNVLTASNADPSQTPGQAADYLAIGAVALAALFAVSRFA